MREQDPIKKTVDELLTPTNIKTYQTILNEPLDKDKSDMIDTGLKVLLWELHELREFKDSDEGFFIGNRVKLVNCTNKTIEDCIGIIVDVDAKEDITLFLVQITQITTKALKAGLEPNEVILTHPDELERL